MYVHHCRLVDNFSDHTRYSSRFNALYPLDPSLSIRDPVLLHQAWPSQSSCWATASAILATAWAATNITLQQQSRIPFGRTHWLGQASWCCYLFRFASPDPACGRRQSVVAATRGLPLTAIVMTLSHRAQIRDIWPSPYVCAVLVGLTKCH